MVFSNLQKPIDKFPVWKGYDFSLAVGIIGRNKWAAHNPKYLITKKIFLMLDDCLKKKFEQVKFA